MHECPRRIIAALTNATVDPQFPIPRQFGNAPANLIQRQVDRFGNVTALEFVRIAHIDEKFEEESTDLLQWQTVDQTTNTVNGPIDQGNGEKRGCLLQFRLHAMRGLSYRNANLRPTCKGIVYGSEFY